MMPVMQFVGNLGYILVSILGGYLAVIKTITVGDIDYSGYELPKEEINK